MMSFLQELMTPPVVAALVVIGFFIVGLYILSIAYVAKDSKRRCEANWGWFVAIAFVPIFGLIVYLVMRPRDYIDDRNEQQLDMSLRERQLEEYGTCPNCGHTIAPDFVVCPECNTQVRNVCPSCHRPLDPDWNVCPYCRTSIHMCEQHQGTPQYAR